MDPSIPDPSEAAFQGLEAHRVRAIRNVVVAVVVAPVNIVIAAKNEGPHPELALVSVVLLTSIQLIAGIRAMRAGLAAWQARMPGMKPPRGARTSIVLGALAAGGAIMLGLFILLYVVVILTFPAPHY